jgi:hypothetical protein
MIFRPLAISIFLLIFLLNQIDASRYRSLRPKRDVCPITTGNTCSFTPCENGGLCQEDPTTIDCNFCICPVGFTGKRCETPVAILPVGCSPGCQNSGFCSGNICICPTGYSGTYCEIRDYCLPTNPCQNGGRCISNTFGYQCDCTGTGYTGTICTDVISIDPCTPSPCQNGGQCSSISGTANCFCINNYLGAYCQIAPVPCAAAPCENGGQCDLIATNVYGCVCPPQFTGTRCETSIMATHPCVTMPEQVCLNGGTCTANGIDYACKCAPGWNGRSCEIQEAASTCTPNPCGHGICYTVDIPTIGSTVFCKCDSQWTGILCDVDMTASCTMGYCLSGGTCQMNGNVPSCQCPALYTGLRCEYYMGALTTPTIPTLSTTTVTGTTQFCYSNPCTNGGTCFENGNTFTCDCPPFWSGATCEYWVGTVTTTPDPTNIPGNICPTNPCNNGGTCYLSGSTFTCVCPPLYTGLFCDTFQMTTPFPLTTPGVPMTCADQPCQNGGTCVTMGNSYSCFCGLSSIYTGKNCDSTTPMPAAECPLNCAPGRCIFSGFATRPYACLWNGIMRPVDGLP